MKKPFCDTNIFIELQIQSGIADSVVRILSENDSQDLVANILVYFVGQFTGGRTEPAPFADVVLLN